MKQAILAASRLMLAAAMLVYLTASGAIDWTAFGGLAAAWPLTLLALLLVFGDHVAAAWRLSVLLAPRGFHLPLAAALRLTLIGTFFNVCLPGSVGGDVVRIYYATEGNRGRRTEVATILLLDRATGLFGLLVWPLLVAPLLPAGGSSEVFRGLLWSAGGLATGLVLAVLLSASSRVRRSCLLARLLPKLPFGSRLERMLDTVHAYRHNPGTLAAAAGISLLAHTLVIGATLLLAQATDPGGFSWQMSVLIPLGFLANAVPLTPGGLGVGEAAFNELFALAGLKGGAEAVLSWRVVNTLISLLGLMSYLQGRRRYVHASPAHGG